MNHFILHYNRRLSLEVIGVSDGVERIFNRLEREIIADTLQETGGNVSRAAEKLKVPRQTLQYKIKIYGLPKP